MPVNWAVLGAEGFESELFGHGKGAFTGAAQDRKGRQRLWADGAVARSGDGQVGEHVLRSSRTLPGQGCAARAATVSHARVARLPAAAATSGPRSRSGGAVSDSTLSP